MSQILYRLAHLTPPPLLRSAKRAVRWPRYWKNLYDGRSGFSAYGGDYELCYLFVAGLPKSGTSWVEAMLAEYAGYNLVSHPEVTVHDYRHGGTHKFEMPLDFFSRLGEALCVIKIHCHGSRNNVDLLARSGLPYCVLYRDLRDAAVSHVCYVKRTPWHSEYPVYRHFNTRDGLLHFADTLLPEWRDWIDSWRENRDPQRSLEVRYEDLLADPGLWMRRIVQLYGLPQDPVQQVVEQNRFDRVRGQSNFFRKGIAGDWINHFDGELRDRFRTVVGDSLIRWGYEKDLTW